MEDNVKDLFAYQQEISALNEKIQEYKKTVSVTEKVSQSFSATIKRNNGDIIELSGSFHKENSIKEFTKEVTTDSTKLSKASSVIATSMKNAGKEVGNATDIMKKMGGFISKTGKDLLSSAKNFAKFSDEQKLAFKKLTGLDPNHAITSIKKMDDSIEVLQSTLFVGLSPVIDMITGVLGDMAGVAGAVAKVLQDNETTVKIVATVIGGLVFAITAYNTVMGIAEAVTTALNVVMAINPIGAVTLAIVGLVGALYLAWNNFEGFREMVWGVWEVVKTVFSNMWKAVTGFVDGIIGVFSGLWKVISDPAHFGEGLEQIGSGIKKAATSFIEANPIVAVTSAVKDGAFQKGVNERKVYEKAQEDMQKKEESKSASAAGSMSVNMANNGQEQSYEEMRKLSGPSAKAVQAPSKSITITINKLVERMEIHSTTIKEGAGQLEDMITQVLIKSVNDFQKTAGI